MSATTPKSTKNDFKVADLSLAEWGRKEIAIAEGEMPALMAIRAVPVPAYDGVMHMDRLDATRAVVIRTDDKDAIDLAVLPLP